MRRQEQSGGDESVNIQAGQNATIHVGITASEARDIALDVYSANFLTLSGIAKDVARARAEQITRQYIETLQARNPAGLASMGDPDMLRALYLAQEGFACSGEADLERALTDLLVDRAGQNERNLKTYVLNQAIATLPKLTNKQRAALAILFFVKSTRYDGPLNLVDFYSYVSNYVLPFVDEMPETLTDFRYMQYTGVGSLSVASITLEGAFYNQAYGYFMNGFTRDQAAAPWQPFLEDSEIFIPCLRNVEKLQIKARSYAEVQELADSKGIPTLMTHVDLGRMYEPEIKADLIAHIPTLAKLFDSWGVWGASGLANFDLTAVGIAIGHAYQRSAVGETTPLEVFLQ
jgi:hypothetical protein